MLIPIFVTGGAGYIGSHACRALKEAGFLPIALDNLSKGHEWAVQWGPLEKIDLQDRSRLHMIFDKWRPKAVMHFAAYANVGESVQQPLKYFSNNVGASLALFEAMTTFDVKTLIFSSTCATYGNPEYMPIDEKHPQHPINPYGQSKWMVEMMLQELHRAQHWGIALLRYFNAAGADVDGLLGEVHDPETHLIPLVIEAAMKKRPAIQIFGTDYPTPDGTAIRDYIHVEDLVQAHLRALNLLLARPGILTLNLGTGKGHSVREVIASVERVSGKKIPFEEVPRREGDPPVLVADSALAKRLLLWEARHVELDAIIASAYHWHVNSQR